MTHICILKMSLLKLSQAYNREFIVVILITLQTFRLISLIDQNHFC